MNANGYAVTFAPGVVTLVELARLVELERRCCPFLRFVITAEPDDGALRLELSGAEGAPPCPERDDGNVIPRRKRKEGTA